MKTVPAAWQPYRRLRRQYWAVVAGMVMTCLVPLFVAIELNVTGPAGLLGLLLLPFGIMIMVYLGEQLSEFECGLSSAILRRHNTVASIEIPTLRSTCGLLRALRPAEVVGS
jgi:hypothetical protein